MLWELLFAGAAAAAAVLLVRLLLVRRQIRGITRQLDRRSRRETGETLKVSFVDGDIEALASRVNALMGEMRQLGVDAKSREDRLKGQIADISHDLRTPLSTIKGYVQLLQKGGVEESRRAEYLRIVGRKADALNGLVNGFYDLSVMDSDDYAPAPERFDAAAALGEILLGFYTAFEQSGRQPRLDLPARAMPVLADPTAFHRIVQNLISNALGHSEGDVAISLRETPDGYAEITVSNDAPDLSQEDVGRLFERFYRADRSRAGLHAGLGLYIVKTLAQKMGGRVSSELKSGRLSVACAFPQACRDPDIS